MYNTNMVGQGTQSHKSVMTSPPTMYSRYKSIEGQAKQAYEIGGGLYSAYKIGRAAYPYIRAGLAAL